MSLDSSLILQLEKVLPSYVKDRRWFRSKLQTIDKVAIDTVIEADGFLILFLDLTYEQGRKDLYLLPITSVTEPNEEQAHEIPIAKLDSRDGGTLAIYDAVFSPFFRNVLLRLMASGGELSSGGAILKAQTIIPLELGEALVASSVSRAEQSNTSLVFGQEFILKLFRKLENGINPDIEIGAFLTQQAFPNTPAVLATLEFRQAGGEPYSAAILQKFVPNEGDAWKYTLQCLDRFYQRAIKYKLDGLEMLNEFVYSAKLLGVRTAQMHAALSKATNNPDFTPETFTLSDAQALSEEMIVQAHSAIDALKSALQGLPEGDHQRAQTVIDQEATIVSRLQSLAHITTSAKRIRFHGDYHLGQLLYTGSDFMIIDFEGEPARPLNQRRAKGLALRDVAGMLRSLQYAAYSALNANHAHEATQLQQASDFWYSNASTLFLDAYFDQASAAPFLPSTPEQRTFFLNALVLQKALYEVQYELNNRPTWVGIPLRGILDLVAA